MFWSGNASISALRGAGHKQSSGTDTLRAGGFHTWGRQHGSATAHWACGKQHAECAQRHESAPSSHHCYAGCEGWELISECTPRNFLLRLPPPHSSRATQEGRQPNAVVMSQLYEEV